MGEWEDVAQSVFIGLIFSFLVAKLISMVLSFREENLRLVREEDLPLKSIDIEIETETETETLSSKKHGKIDSAASMEVTEHGKLSTSEEALGYAEKKSSLGESESGTASVPSVGNEESVEDDDDDDDDDDDWEGVESTELDEAFSAATAFVATAAADRYSPKVSSEVQLQLYGLFKIATEGPCSVPQPSALKMTARAKWYNYYTMMFSLYALAVSMWSE